MARLGDGPARSGEAAFAIPRMREHLLAYADDLRRRASEQA